MTSEAKLDRFRKRVPMSEARINRYLEVLAKTGSRLEAAQAASAHLADEPTHHAFGSEAFRQLRLRDPVFAAREQEALDKAVGALEAEVQRRAFVPDRRPVPDKAGNVIGWDENWRSANTLALRILARHKPDDWVERRDNHNQVTVTNADPAPSGPSIRLTADDIRCLSEERKNLLWELLDEIQSARALTDSAVVTDAPAPAALPAPPPAPSGQVQP